LHKSACGGEGTGKNPTDRSKLGRKWSILVDNNGIPVGCNLDGASRNDSVLLAPTLDDNEARGWLSEIEIWPDRGYDFDATPERLAAHDLIYAVVAKRRKRGSEGPKSPNRWGLFVRSSELVALELRRPNDVTTTATVHTGTRSSLSPS